MKNLNVIKLKYGDVFTIFVAEILTSILWIKAGYYWGWIFFLWVGGSVINMLQARKIKSIEKTNKELDDVVSSLDEKLPGFKELFEIMRKNHNI